MVNMSEKTPEIPLESREFSKSQLQRLEIDFNTAVRTKGLGHLETVKILGEWMDSKQLQVDEGSEGHPKELAKVRFNLALGILFLHNELWEEAQESLDTAAYLLSELTHTIGVSGREEIQAAIKDYDHDIDYYLNVITKNN